MIDASESTDYRNAPAIVVFSDHPQSAGLAEAAVSAAGARLVASLSLDEAVPRLDVQAGVAVVVVEVASDLGPMFDALLDRIDAAAHKRHYAAVVIIPVELIDAAAARISHPDIILVAAPDPAQRAAAIATACAARRLSLRDIGADGGAARLIELTEEVGRIARALAALSVADTARPQTFGLESPRPSYSGRPADVGETNAATLRAIIRTRQLRDQHFSADLFADPAWDMLLDLMVARLEGRGVAVSSLCIAAAVPPTTALRWIRSMTENGMFVRRADPNDGRRVFIELAEQTARAMTAYLSAAARVLPLST